MPADREKFTPEGPLQLLAKVAIDDYIGKVRERGPMLPSVYALLRCPTCEMGAAVRSEFLADADLLRHMCSSGQMAVGLRETVPRSFCECERGMSLVGAVVALCGRPGSAAGGSALFVVSAPQGAFAVTTEVGDGALYRERSELPKQYAIDLSEPCYIE